MIHHAIAVVIGLALIFAVGTAITLLEEHFGEMD
jgi:hypothetical protein